MATGNLKNVRVDDDIWLPAVERAQAEGTNVSALIRQWLADYAATGSPVAGGKRPPVRLTAAEREQARLAIWGLMPDRDKLLDQVVDAVNSAR